MVWASGGVAVSDFFFDKSIFFLLCVGGGVGGGWVKGWGEGKCTYMNKCFKWHFYSSRRPPVQNYF